MTQARRRLISLEDTPYYHCISRCVRRAFLCGKDPYSGQSFEHRRQWVLDRLKQLSHIFAIDICAYAILSNHHHIVLRVDTERAKQWTEKEVIERWCCLFKGTVLTQRFIQGELLDEAERQALQVRVEIWRDRLISISWFMKQLNESIARQANKEDGCKGRFWESRFKSQALLDNTAVLACMAYVDLNPVRAGIAESVEESDFTSIQERLLAIKNRSKKRYDQQKSTDDNVTQSTKLLPFAEVESQEQSQVALPFTLKDYIDLVDWTGRLVREDKSGAIPGNPPSLLRYLGLDEKQWRLLSIDIQQYALNTLGTLEQLEIYNATINRRWMPRQTYLKACYSTAA